MKVFDTHAHLSASQFKKDRQELIDSFAEKGVALVVECATEEKDFDLIAKIGENEGIYTCFGVHPHSASEISKDYKDKIVAQLQNPKAVAIGEIGLDYHYDFSPRDTQKQVFCEQIELAIAHNKPLVLHEREAHADMLAILQYYAGKFTGVMHCYSGSVEMMPRFLDLGLYLGIGGTATFPNAQKTRDVARMVPLDRIVLETDCPYLTPHPFRGKRNDPTYVKVICENIAELREMDAEELAQITLENGKKLFNIK